jgi:DNA-binding GntR family transcriptional regulator
MAFPPDFSSIQTKTMMVARHLRREIISGRIPVGSSLRQDHLARELGLSSTPVREALRLLEAEGFVQSIPHHGVRVAERNPNHVFITFELRRHIEGLAAELAATHITDAEIAKLESLLAEMQRLVATGNARDVRGLDVEFHETINYASRMPQLQSMIYYLWAGLDWSLLETDPERLHGSLEEHRDLLDALRRRDGTAAREVMVRQIDNSQRHDLAALDGRPGNERHDGD